MIGWHGTHGDFEAFDESMFGSDGGRSPNGRLGVWVYLEEGLAESAGPRVLRVEAEIPEHRVARFPVSRMFADHKAATRSDDPHGYFDRLRAKLLADGFQAVEVVEHTGEAKMGIVLDLSSITSVQDMAPAPGMR